MMKRFWRLSVCNIFLAWILTACSTPGTRGLAHATALHQLSPADQQLVLHGKIRPGMSPEAVEIAWGGPDDKIPGTGKSASETWVYRQRVTIYSPMNSYYYYGPYHGLGGGSPGRGFLPDYAYGGVGYEGTLRYQPHVRSLDSVRLAEFSGGKVDRYKEADGTWSQPLPVVAAARPSAVALTARAAARKMPHLARHTIHRDGSSRTARHAVHHDRRPASGPRLAAGSHRSHDAKHRLAGKSRHLQTTHAGGQRAGAERGGSSGHHAGHSVHGLGHSHSGTHRQPNRTAT